MQYDWKTDSMGGITITRLADGATRYLQSQDDVEAWEAKMLTPQQANALYKQRGPGAYGEALDAMCAEYFAE